MDMLGELTDALDYYPPEHVNRKIQYVTDEHICFTDSSIDGWAEYLFDRNTKQCKLTRHDHADP